MLAPAVAEPWPKVSVVSPRSTRPGTCRMSSPNCRPGCTRSSSSTGTRSPTRSRRSSARPDIRIVRQNRRGKGNALACGFAAATGDIIAMVDADGSADPAEIPLFVQALLDGGFRQRHPVRRRRRQLRHHPAAPPRQPDARGLVNVLCRTKYSDLCYGYNVFWRRHVPVFGLDAESDVPVDGDTRLWGDGFEVETLINIRIAQAGLKVKEVASYEHSRIHGVSNLNARRDGLRPTHHRGRALLHHRRLVAQRSRASQPLAPRQQAVMPQSASRAACPAQALRAPSRGGRPAGGGELLERTAGGSRARSAG